MFYEWIKREAFEEADMSDVVALFNHDNNYVLGRSLSGTLRFTKNNEGIDYEIDAPETPTIRDLVLAPMKRRDITGSSFQFSIYEDDGDKWEYDKKTQTYNRTILRVKKLYDLSPVTMPAYSQTTSTVGKRSLDSYKKELQDLEDKQNQQLLEEQRREQDDLNKRSMARARVTLFAVTNY